METNNHFHIDRHHNNAKSCSNSSILLGGFGFQFLIALQHHDAYRNNQFIFLKKMSSLLFEITWNSYLHFFRFGQFLLEIMRFNYFFKREKKTFGKSFVYFCRKMMRKPYWMHRSQSNGSVFSIFGPLCWLNF